MRRTCLATVAMLAAISTACSGGHSSARSATSSTTAGGAAKSCATPARGWDRTDLHPVTQPALAGCNFLVYTASAGALHVTALDAATGRTVWQADASASDATNGVSPSLAVAGGLVMFLQGIGSGITESARLVGVQGATGKQVWSSPAADFTGWPALCPDDATVVCATAVDPATEQTGVLRYTAATGHALPYAVIPGSGGRDIGPGLYDPGARNPDQLVAVRGGAVAWQRTLASIFPEPGLSSDYGWNFDLVPAKGLFVGSVGGAPLAQSATTVDVDLSKSMTAGFRTRDGVPAWTDKGSQFVCTQLPCSANASLASTAYQPPTIGVRLRGAGRVHFVIATETPTFSPDAKITLEGFDLGTGRTTWSFNLGQNLALVENGSPPQTGAESIAIAGPGGGLTGLDLATGARTALSPTAVAWCQAETTYTLKASVAAPGAKPERHQGEDATFPCNPLGKRVPAPKLIPAFVGPSRNGLTAWSEANRVVGTPTGNFN